LPTRCQSGLSQCQRFQNIRFALLKVRGVSVQSFAVTLPVVDHALIIDLEPDSVNRDLEAAIAAGTFRSDLFYRLNVFPIEIPPLRERRADIPLLVAYFIDHFARKAGKSFRGINKRTLELLVSYPWPGNIRELQNVVERSVIVCETENFSVDESWLSRRSLAGEPKSQSGLSQKLAAQEKEMIEAALRESGGRVAGPSGAAAKLGIHRSTLELKITSLKINKYRYKTEAPTKNN
jgi:transcriptional regulator with PAS, ATPase and Fis domain